MDGFFLFGRKGHGIHVHGSLHTSCWKKGMVGPWFPVRPVWRSVETLLSLRITSQADDVLLGLCLL
jgi:hypothetical protein